MAFKRQINKEVDVGAYEIKFHDDNQTATISYTQYDENGVAEKFLGTKLIPFAELAEKYGEDFITINAFFQTLCDDYNPDNPNNSIIE